MIRRERSNRSGLWLAVVFTACGTRSNDEIPPALLDAIAQRGDSAAAYPEGPYGGKLGDIAPDVCIRGWHHPREADYDPERLERICLSDFWDPEAREHQLLLVNTSAIWCSACRVEYGGSGNRPSLSRHLSERRGLRLLGALFQDAAFEPADEADAVAWARTYAVDFSFGLDAPFVMGAFADAEVQPFNMVIDTRSMRIVLQVDGDEPTTLWPAIDSLLE